MNKFFLLIWMVTLFSCGGSDSDSSSSGNVGQAGSLATFTIAKNNLYVMDGDEVIAFSLAQPTKPKRIDDFYLSRADGETIFSHQNNYLFIGRQSGVDILALDEQGHMDFLASHSHVTSCDPVIAQGNRSFLTTRSGQGCWFGDNRLEVLDITDIAKPNLIYEMPMSAPSGLAISENDLFVCDLYDGLKRFVIDDSGEQISLNYGHISDIYDCKDIIIQNERLILMSDEGVTQVRWQGDNFTKLSQIFID